MRPRSGASNRRGARRRAPGAPRAAAAVLAAVPLALAPGAFAGWWGARGHLASAAQQPVRAGSGCRATARSERAHGRRSRHRCPARRPRGGATGTGPVSSGTGVPPAVTPAAGGGLQSPPPGPAAGSGGEGTPAPPAGPARVEITAEDSPAFRFALSRPAVPAGRVVIEFVNHGQDEHNLHAVAEGAEAGSLPDTLPGGHPSLTLDMHPGSYTFFCSLPGHEAKGMHATLAVEAASP